MTKQLLILALFGSLTFGIAADVNIDAQIEAIKAAPTAKRVELMNQLKVQIAKMNAEERAQAIQHLQSQMHAQVHQEVETAHENAQQHHTMAQLHIEDHVTHMQEENQQHMQHMQEMQQHNVAQEHVAQEHIEVHSDMSVPQGSEVIHLQDENHH